VGWPFHPVLDKARALSFFPKKFILCATPKGRYDGSRNNAQKKRFGTVAIQKGLIAEEQLMSTP
jgi:hypothetical protein